MKYHIVKDGETVFPRMKNYYLKCCDCGLVHKIDFKITGKRLSFKAVRVTKTKLKGEHNGNGQLPKMRKHRRSNRAQQ